MQRIENGKNTPVYYQAEMWREAPLRHGMFTRHGGISEATWASLNVGGTVGDDLQAVEENHRRMYAALNLKPEQACTVWQVHGTDTVMAHDQMPQRKWLARADAMITNKPGLVLTMRFADCVPILFYDPAARAVGLAHAGWRGTVDGMVESTVKAMSASFGTRPQDLQAVIGPSIGPDKYQVGEEVVQAVAERYGTTEGFITRAVDGSAYLNLWAANEASLQSCGVQAIERADICTATNTDDFFSHRAEKGKTGRFGVVIVLDQ